MFNDRNEKVQKAPKHDFLTCWSVLGAFVSKTHFVVRAANFCQLMPILGGFVAKNHFVIRAVNFCQLMPILAYIGTRGCHVFYRNEKVPKAPKTRFLDILECIGCVRGKNSLRDPSGEHLSINANIGIYWHTRVRCFQAK